MLESFIEFDKYLFVLINQQWSAVWLDPFMIFFSSKWALVPMYIFAIIGFIRKFASRFYMPLLICLLAFALSDSISSRIFKPGFKRIRPAFEAELNPRLPDGKPGGHFGFVSSHAANAFAVYPLISILLFTSIDSRKPMNKRAKIGLVFMLGLSFIVSYSRVYLGVHYVGDVFFGAIFGLLVGYSCWKLYCSQWVQKLM